MRTGSNGGSIQRKLGEENFVKLIRHGWDRGIRYIDTADNYKIHDLVGKAIKGLPREELVLLTKMKWTNSPDVKKELDRFRTELGVEYLDIVLIHCVTEAGWPQKLQKMCDDLAAAKQAGTVRAVGVSQHTLQALREVAGSTWVDVNLVRVNHNGHYMDGTTGKWGEPAEVSPVMEEVKKIHDAGKGVLGMKLIGNGDFKNAEDREKAIQAVMKSGCVDAVTIGFKSPEEMWEIFSEVPESIHNTSTIAEKCNLELIFNELHLPKYDLPEGFNSLDDYLESLCKDGLRKRFSKTTREIEDRLNHELKVIKESKFAGYFLIVNDFVQFAKKNGIDVGPGRGSAAGSLISYLLGITNLDPLKFGLFFERFLNPERISPPDIDIDFREDRRNEVIEYITNRYGKENVAQIIKSKS